MKTAQNRNPSSATTDRANRTQYSSRVAPSGDASPLAIRTILVPTDFSPLSNRAVTYARRFAEHFAARLILLHVTEPVTYAPAYGRFDTVEELRAAKRVAAEDSLAQLIADSEPPGVKPVSCQAIVAEGDSAAETDRIAREQLVDLIVIASHGFGGLTHLLLGSTTEKVMRHAPCPVLVVREKQRDFVWER